jgi:ATP-dependent DNA ligase
VSLPIQAPFPPMEALLVEEIPQGGDWQYEPKWDGFRCLIFRDGSKVQLQSKAGQPLERYFPELVAGVLEFKAARFVLDGEIAIPVGNKLSFNELLLRIHPAASRVQKLAQASPSIFVAFDLLVAPTGESLVERPLRERRAWLEQFARDVFPPGNQFRLSPATTDIVTARRWLKSAGSDLDGIMAKQLNLPYCSGERVGMEKIKPNRTADCVVGGFRYAAKKKVVGSLLLGLYNESGLLDHVGFCSSFKAAERKSLLKKLTPLVEPPGFTGHAPGGPSRWSAGRSTEWEPLRPELVVEVSYDHFTNGRFRHGTKLLRWRPDKAPDQCRMHQVVSAGQAAFRLLTK